MNARKLFIIILTTILISSLLIGVVSALSTDTSNSTSTSSTTLSNVRDYASAPTTDTRIGTNYAVDAGRLYIGGPASWAKTRNPRRHYR